MKTLYKHVHLVIDDKREYLDGSILINDGIIEDEAYGARLGGLRLRHCRVGTRHSERDGSKQEHHTGDQASGAEEQLCLPVRRSPHQAVAAQGEHRCEESLGGERSDRTAARHRTAMQGVAATSDDLQG